MRSSCSFVTLTWTSTSPDLPAISYNMETGAMEDISHIDVFTVLMVLILGTVFQVIHHLDDAPITISVAFIVTMDIIFGLTYAMDTFFISEIMLIVATTGAKCDSCIFVIVRYREELRDSKDHHNALHGTTKWAGKSISISAASVITGFVAVSICLFSMIFTVDICLAIGIIIALLAALTFIPSILALVEDRIFCRPGPGNTAGAARPLRAGSRGAAGSDTPTSRNPPASPPSTPERSWSWPSWSPSRQPT